MIVLIVLFAPWMIFRGCGALGVTPMASWHNSARYALAVMFLFTGTAHFNRMKHDLARMVPQSFPHPMLVIYVTGVLEFLGAIGLLLPRGFSLAAVCLVLLLVVMFPANVKAAREKLLLAGRPATRLWLRLPMQLFFIAILLWSART